MTLPERVDVAIVGAGTAGAAAAWHCAARGLRVLVLDRKPLDAAGARWMNAVPGWQFDLAGVPRPTGDELTGDEAVGFHLLAGRGPERAVIRDHGMLEVDMARLVSRLQRNAREAGALFEGDVRVVGLEGGLLCTDAGDVRADAFVDASGVGGAGLLGGPPEAREDLCAAAQDVYEIADRAAAEAYFARHEIPLGDILSFAGTAGGFSVLNLRLVDGHISMLTGSIPALGHPSGRAMIDAFVREHAFIGRPIRQGARAIPLGRPREIIAEGRVAAVGDAARQVFAAHGSGIGAGLIAARTLADALADGDGPERYASRWQRSQGGLLAAYDIFRRMAQRLSVSELRRLMRTGLMDAEMMRPGMSQTPPELGPRTLAAKAPAALAEPALVGRFVNVAARMTAMQALYRGFPSRPGRRRALWSRAVSELAG